MRSSLVALTLAALAPSAAAQPATYTFQNLGAIDRGLYSFASGINNAGQVVGAARWSPSLNGYIAFRTSPTGGVGGGLGYPGLGIDSAAYGINASGGITGTVGQRVYASMPGGTIANPTPWVDLGVNGQGNAINDAYMVAGAQGQFGGPFRAFRYGPTAPLSPYTITDLGTLGGTTSYGESINSSGQVAGYSTTVGGNIHAFRTTATGLVTEVGTDLGTLGGPQSIGVAIDDSGRVIGSSTLANGKRHAFVSTPNGQPLTLTDLGTLPGFDESFADGINALGVIVGSSAVGTTSHAFIFDGGQMWDLNSLTIGLGSAVLTGASGINEAGQICGTCEVPGYIFPYIGPYRFAFRLTPVPEPSALALAGLAAVGVAARRRWGR